MMLRVGQVYGYKGQEKAMVTQQPRFGGVELMPGMDFSPAQERGLALSDEFIALNESTRVRRGESAWGARVTGLHLSIRNKLVSAFHVLTLGSRQVPRPGSILHELKENGVSDDQLRKIIEAYQKYYQAVVSALINHPQDAYNDDSWKKPVEIKEYAALPDRIKLISDLMFNSYGVLSLLERLQINETEWNRVVEAGRELEGLLMASATNGQVPDTMSLRFTTPKKTHSQTTIDRFHRVQLLMPQHGLSISPVGFLQQLNTMIDERYRRTRWGKLQAFWKGALVSEADIALMARSRYGMNQEALKDYLMTLMRHNLIQRSEGKDDKGESMYFYTLSDFSAKSIQDKTLLSKLAVDKDAITAYLEVTQESLRQKKSQLLDAYAELSLRLRHAELEPARLEKKHIATLAEVQELRQKASQAVSDNRREAIELNAEAHAREAEAIAQMIENRKAWLQQLSKESQPTMQSILSQVQTVDHQLSLIQRARQLVELRNETDRFNSLMRQYGGGQSAQQTEKSLIEELTEILCDTTQVQVKRQLSAEEQALEDEAERILQQALAEAEREPGSTGPLDELASGSGGQPSDRKNVS
jgi:DNA-binding HxlR family transcriptional regulator